VVCRIFHKSSGIKKVVMPSYAMAAMSMSMGDQHHQQQSFVVDSGSACTLPPLMDYNIPSLLAPSPPQLHTPSSYQLQAASIGTSMTGAALPTMNRHYFGNNIQHQMMGPPPMSFYQQQMQMMDQGFMTGAGPGSGPSSMVSNEDIGTGLNNKDQCMGTTTEISSTDMGMDGMWKY
jgi:hypothetical protein